jgi:hypothetical protein
MTTCVIEPGAAACRLSHHWLSYLIVLTTYPIGSYNYQLLHQEDSLRCHKLRFRAIVTVNIDCTPQQNYLPRVGNTSCVLCEVRNFVFLIKLS